MGRGRTGRLALYALGVVAVLAVGVLAVMAGTGALSGADADPAKRAIQPVGAEGTTPEPVTEEAARTADDTEPKDRADQIARAVQEPEPKEEQPDAEIRFGFCFGVRFLVCPRGRSRGHLHDPERADDRHLGHPRRRRDGRGQPLTGCRALRRLRLPLGCRLQHLHSRAPVGYPGTPSDHVFWNLPNLVQGDKIYLPTPTGTPTPMR